MSIVNSAEGRIPNDCTQEKRNNGKRQRWVCLEFLVTKTFCMRIKTEVNGLEYELSCTAGVQT